MFFDDWTAAEWTALGTMLLAAITLGLVGFGYLQLRSIRDEARNNRTLAACERYDTDPVIDASLRRLDKGLRNGRLRADPANFRLDVLTILNYCDSVAIGIRRGVYDGEMVRAHHAVIFKKHFDRYLGEEAIRIPGIAPEDFECFTALCTEWGRPAPLRWWQFE